jgi:hypothetical protein
MTTYSADDVVVGVTLAGVLGLVAAIEMVTVAGNKALTLATLERSKAFAARSLIEQRARGFSVRYVCSLRCVRKTHSMDSARPGNPILKPENVVTSWLRLAIVRTPDLISSRKASVRIRPEFLT